MDGMVLIGDAVLFELDHTVARNCYCIGAWQCQDLCARWLPNLLFFNSLLDTTVHVLYQLIS